MKINICEYKYVKVHVASWLGGPPRLSTAMYDSIISIHPDSIGKTNLTHIEILVMVNKFFLLNNLPGRLAFYDDEVGGGTISFHEFRHQFPTTPQGF